MPHELMRWCDEILPAIHAISDEMFWLYSEKANLHHYRDLAAQFEARFKDANLAKCAFLHGVSTVDLQQGSLRSQVSEDVLAILEEREKLRALNMEDLDVNEALLADVLRSLQRAHSIVLLVLEQLHHLDPDGKMARWSLRFHQSPGNLPQGLPRVPVYKYGHDRDNMADFSRNVVAPTAKFFGLWRERNVIEDATLLFFQPERFELLRAFAVQESRHGGECERMTNLIIDRLGDLLMGGQVESVRWEWRHIGSLHRQLPQSTIPDWRKLLYRAGYVSIVCRNDEDCYRALYRLHSQLRYRPTEFRDTVGEATPAGYRALHTALTPPEGVGILAEAIPIRLLPRESNPVRRHRFDRRRLVDLERRWRSVVRVGLHVFTPDGRRVELPVGATVLDFAYALNSKWVAHLKGATVNRQPVDVVHQLKPNDVVWLDLAETPQPLPQGWEKKVHRSRVGTIKEKFRRHFAPALEVAGEAWLRNKLFLKGISELPAKNDLDTILLESAGSLQHFKELPDAQWLWRQLGLLAAIESGEDLPFHLRLDSLLADKLVENLAREISDKLTSLSELEIPYQLSVKLKDVVRCARCEPSFQEPLVGIVIQEHTLQLHSAGSRCSEGGFPVSRARLTSVHPQYLVIQTTNRVGVAADILACFQRHRLNVVEVVGSEVMAGWGVLRVRVDYTGRTRLEEIYRELLDTVPGVSRVVGPDEPEVPALEAALPPRRTLYASGWAPPPPYICGNDITDDAYFYGMQDQKGLLRRVFDEASKSISRNGRTVFVYGPKRVGKTSLVNCFLRELDRDSHRPCITIYHEAAPSSWEENETLLTEALRRRVVDLVTRRGGINLKILEGASFFDLAELARQTLGASVVLAVDEVVGLLDCCKDAAREVLLFRSRIQLQAGLLVIWVGPEAPVLHLPESLRNILQRSELLPLEGLRREEVAALLRAEKLSPKIRIEVPESVANAVHKMTRGNPYWVSFLGREMWRRARLRDEVGVKYDSMLLEMAKRRLFILGMPFANRLSSEAGLLEGLTGRILVLLAEQPPGQDGVPRPLDRNEICVELTKREAGIDVRMLESKLEDLRARGALSEMSSGSSQAWRISAPILAEYINYRRLSPGVEVA